MSSSTIERGPFANTISQTQKTKSERLKTIIEDGHFLGNLLRNHVVCEEAKSLLSKKNHLKQIANGEPNGTDGKSEIEFAALFRVLNLLRQFPNEKFHSHFLRQGNPIILTESPTGRESLYDINQVYHVWDLKKDLLTVLESFPTRRLPFIASLRKAVAEYSSNNLRTTIYPNSLRTSLEIRKRAQRLAHTSGAPQRTCFSAKKHPTPHESLVPSSLKDLFDDLVS